MVIGVHGGLKFYRGAARAARAYAELDHSRADDYYLGEGNGVAERLIATIDVGVQRAGSMDGETYERWVAGVDLDTGGKKGHVRADANALRFVEVVINGPKTWSLAAALYPEISAALDGAQDKAVAEIVNWVAGHATTRVGPRGQQAQVRVERIEAAAIRHYTSRSGDPHRHIHLQINARVWAASAWRGLHSVGLRDSIEAINGIGHAAVVADPAFRRALATHGLTMNRETNEIQELTPYVGEFSARTAQIRRHIDNYEAAWRADHPDEQPGPRLREVWDRRAWADARPDKIIPDDGRQLVSRWNTELRDLGYRDPGGPVSLQSVLPGQLDRDAAAELVVSAVGAGRSAWNAADLRGGVEALLAQALIVADTGVRREVAEDVTARAVARSVRLLERRDVPEHVRNLTSDRVLDVESDLVARLARRAVAPAHRASLGVRGWTGIDPDQAAVIGSLAGDGQLIVVEGAAGAGKTTALRSARLLLAGRGHRMIIVTPTLKAAEVAATETGAAGHSAAWLVHQSGWRWDGNGRWTRNPESAPDSGASLTSGDLLLVDEAGMLDQDTALALLTIADETGARIGLVGDRHQLPAVGRGGVLDHAQKLAHPSAVVTLGTVHRFTDPDYAALTLRMRVADDPCAVFDALLEKGHVVLHASEVERTVTLADAGARGDLVIADTREQVADLNAAIRDRRPQGEGHAATITTAAGAQICAGDRVATRRNDRDLQLANRQTWTVAQVRDNGGLLLHGQGRRREIPAEYASRFVELAYATTVHGAQGDTVPAAHCAIGEQTGAAAAYVAMTRGRHTNTAHLVAADLSDARRQWVDVFSRDRADLGPGRARLQAIEAIERYGPAPQDRTGPAAQRHERGERRGRTRPLPVPSHDRSSPGIGF